MNAFSLKDHTALVTGSTRGIGLSIALGMVEAGADVIFHGNSTPPDAVPNGCLFLKGDLLDPANSAKLIDQAFAEKPAFDTLICNAGSFFDTSFLQMTEERFDKTMALNVKSVYFVIQAFAKRMVELGRAGSVVIISSTNSFQAEDQSSAYDASKGAALMLTKTLATSLADHNIRVNGVAPGLIYTPLTRPSLEKNPAKVEHYHKKALLRRIGEPEECTGAVVFLASAAASYITGETIIVDGGLTVTQIGRMKL